MKKILWLLALALALPMAAFAGTAWISAQRPGTLAGTTSGLSLTGSTLIAVNGYEGEVDSLPEKSNLGSGRLYHRRAGKAVESLQMAAPSLPAEAFTITGNGTNGVPSGVLFSGTFSSATWTLVTPGKRNP